MEKKVSKATIYLNDLFMGLMTLIAIVGVICILVVGGFIGISGAIYIVKSFSFTGAKTIIGGIVMSILALGTCALMFYANYMATKATINSWKKYLTERKALTVNINDQHSQQNNKDEQ